MKYLKHILTVFFIALYFNVEAQKPRIETIRWVEMTTAERDALTISGSDVWLIKNSTTGNFEYYDGTQWINLNSGSQDLQSVTDNGNTTNNSIKAETLAFRDNYSGNYTDWHSSIDAISLRINQQYKALTLQSGISGGLKYFNAYGNNASNYLRLRFNAAKTSNFIIDVPDVTAVMPFNFTDGTTTVSADANGLVDLSGLDFGGSGWDYTATQNIGMAGYDIINSGNIETDNIYAPSGIFTDASSTVLTLNNNITGNYVYSRASPSTADTFTTAASPLADAFKAVYIDTTGDTVFPTVTGATQITGATFEADTLYKMIVFEEEGSIYYYFLKWE